ncbi:hypothetical protein CS390_10635 [Pseudomonas sp. HLS-6]|uniref:hypothetical protein n=1 Tax=Pseudomonas sp. HLS-6 TaxID=2049589 RepID=UPI000C1816A2|nr:hypothetical protein [Pseudomonas sp. HLS-6]ATR82972.1 hypothetical protein CS390_10635 [Pseudomonas sp. HLS-6]
MQQQHYILALVALWLFTLAFLPFLFATTRHRASTAGFEDGLAKRHALHALEIEELEGELAKTGAECESLRAKLAELDADAASWVCGECGSNAQTRNADHPVWHGKPRANIHATAAREVLAERRRQIKEKGYTPEHDEHYKSGELAKAAAVITLLGIGTTPEWPPLNNICRWPVKKEAPRRMLVKACALILAEIERLDRTQVQS